MRKLANTSANRRSQSAPRLRTNHQRKCRPRFHHRRHRHRQNDHAGGGPERNQSHADVHVVTLRIQSSMCTNRFARVSASASTERTTSIFPSPQGALRQGAAYDPGRRNPGSGKPWRWPSLAGETGHLFSRPSTRSTPVRRSTASWACSTKTRRRSCGSGGRCAKMGGQPAARPAG